MQASRISLQHTGLQKWYGSLFVRRFLCDIKGYLCVYYKTKTLLSQMLIVETKANVLQKTNCNFVFHFIT